MDSYKRFYQPDDSGISVEHWIGSLSQNTHKHRYYELVFIEKGSCTHSFCGEENLLIPGDSFLVRPETAHGFTIREQTSIYNCQFYPDKLDEQVFSLISGMKPVALEHSVLKKEPAFFRANINKQGIIHLDANDRMFFQSLLGDMCRAQEEQANYDKLLKQKYLEVILIIYRKCSDRQFKNYFSQPPKNQSLIMKALIYIEENITTTLDFNELAREQNLSPNHFRKLFKDATGLSLVEYVNRLRITKARELLMNTDLSISEIAASVGIYDSNYFSRMFKNFMGYSPKQYIRRSNL